MTDDDAPGYGLADPLSVDWSLPAAGLARPAQPDPTVVQLNLILPSARDLDAGIGTLVTLAIWFGSRSIAGRRADVGFVGRVADGTATPHRDGMLYRFTCSGLVVDLTGYSPGVAPLPAQTARARFDALVSRSGIAAADLEVDTLLTWDPALFVDQLEPGADPLSDVLGELLDQLAFAYLSRLYRGILAARPATAGGKPRWYVDALSDEYVATAEAPLPAVFGPMPSPPYSAGLYGLTINRDDRFAGVIDACLVDFEAEWSTLIPDVANVATVTWISVAAAAAAVTKDTDRIPASLTWTEWDAQTPKVATRKTETLATTDTGAAAAAATNAQRLAELATLPPQTVTGWSPESFRWLLYADPAGLEAFPLIFPAPHIDPAVEGTRSLRTAAYVRPLVVAGIPTPWDPTGSPGMATGQAAQVTLTIERGRPVVDLTLSPTLPVPGNSESTVPNWDAVAGTWDAQAPKVWDDYRGGYVIFRWDDPALTPATWDTLEPTQTWYEYRLARGSY